MERPGGAQRQAHQQPDQRTRQPQPLRPGRRLFSFVT